VARKRPKGPRTRFCRRVSGTCRPKDDQGVILVLWTIGLTAIAGLLALAIDYGYGVQGSSNIQNAANASALAAASVLWGDSPQAACGDPGSVSTPSDEAEDIAVYCYGLTDGDWTDCTGAVAGYSAPPPNFSPYPGSPINCVAFDFTTDVVWVDVPPQSIPSLFLSNGGATVSRVAYAVTIGGQPELCYMTSISSDC